MVLNILLLLNWVNPITENYSCNHFKPEDRPITVLIESYPNCNAQLDT